MINQEKPRLLTGDTPTGRLHLGHFVGSLENRVKLQDQYDCYFIIANVHAFTTRAERPAEIKKSVMDIAMDYLAAGIDPAKSSIFIQSEIPSIAEMSVFFSMLLPYNRVMRNPTIKDEIRDKGLSENYSFGFLLYAVGQMADILLFRPEIIPVGEDQVPHIEMTREVARRFNQIYCGVDVHTRDEEHLNAGGLFPIVKPLIGRVKRLVGIGPPNKAGVLLKMSKSFNNAILLSDDDDTISRKIMSMYTDPKRLKATDKGSVENNPLWIFHDVFNNDKEWLFEYKDRYKSGQVGDVECKKRLIDILVALITPMRKKREYYEKHEDAVLTILKEGTKRANTLANSTFLKAKKYMQQDYF